MNAFLPAAFPSFGVLQNPVGEASTDKIPSRPSQNTRTTSGPTARNGSELLSPSAYRTASEPLSACNCQHAKFDQFACKEFTAMSFAAKRYVSSANWRTKSAAH